MRLPALVARARRPVGVSADWLTGSPASRILDAGEPVILWQAPLGRVSAYQWQHNAGSGWVNSDTSALGASVAGLTGPVLRVPDVTGMNGWQFRCAATTPAGTAYSPVTTLTVGSGQHATWYLDPGASGNDDTGTGSSDLPWKTLSKAAAMIASGTIGPGDTIVLKAGTYSSTGQTLLLDNGDDGTSAEPIRWTNSGTVTWRGDSSSGAGYPLPLTTPSVIAFIQGQHHHFDFDGNVTLTPHNTATMGVFAIKDAGYVAGTPSSPRTSDLIFRGMTSTAARTWHMQVHGYWESLCFADLDISGGGQGTSDSTNECIYLGRAPDSVTYSPEALDKPSDILIWNSTLNATGGHSPLTDITNSNAVDAKCGTHRVVIDGCTMSARHETVSCEGSHITVRNNTITSVTTSGGSGNTIRIGTSQSTRARVGLDDPDLDGGGAHVDIWDNALTAAAAAIVLDDSMDTDQSTHTDEGIDAADVGDAGGCTGTWVTRIGLVTGGDGIAVLDPGEIAVYDDFDA